MAKEIFNGKELKVLNLIIKREYFDAILSGEKKEEYREIKVSTIDRYLGDNGPIKYDALRLYVGYNKDRDTALVEVKSAEACILTDDHGNNVKMALPPDPDNGNKVEYVDQYVMCYHLGRVLQSLIHK